MQDLKHDSGMAPQRPGRAVGARQIGPIVGGCIVVGFIAAVVLVLGPFAGAEEHIITGVALLALAFGWALLLLLSARTDQPQRWAAAPATFMALVGVGLLVFAPNANVLDTLGWVWPAAVMALVVWMTARVRRDLRSWARQWLLYPLFGLLALAAVGGAHETVRESLDRAAFAMPGQLVGVDGHRLHLHCTGAGSPTVVLEAGLGEPSSSWGWIVPAVARATKVCVYDRAGRGWSEPAARPLDGNAVANDLHTLLNRAQIDQPYVVVGHSIGGLYALTFAARYADEVAGVVLLDATSPEAFTRLPTYPAFYAGYRRISALFPSLARMGIARLVYGSNFGTLPSQARDEQRAFWSTARQARSMRDELAEAPTAMKQAQSLKSLGDRPLFVLTAASGAQSGWQSAQDELAKLSANSVHRVLPDATHSSLVYDEGSAAASSQAILAVVESVRTAKPLATVGVHLLPGQSFMPARRAGLSGACLGCP
jgi:pimeloyl-ACP methyl ester carboxylesterase